MRLSDPAKQEKIIQAVFTLVGKQGLAGLNIAGISKTAGIGVGTFYTYFRNKEELIQAAYSSVEHRMTLKMYEGYDSRSPIKASLKQIYVNALNYRLKHYDETVFIDQYIQSRYVQINFSRQIKEYERQNKPLYDLMQRGKREGLFMELDDFMMISFINGSIRSSSNSIARKIIPLSKQFIENCFTLVWKGITI